MSDKPLVLTVDDSDLCLMVTGMVLSRMGFEAMAARSGEEALRLLQTVRPCAVLLDLMMPDMDGLQTLDALRKQPEWKDLPVYILSAFARDNAADRALEAGANGFLTKPIQVHRLHTILQNHVPAGDRERRRAHPRTRFEGAVRVEVGSHTETLMATNLSEGGIFCRRGEMLPIGTPVTVLLTVPPDGATLRIPGAVIHNRGVLHSILNHPLGIAISFQDLPEPEMLRLRAFVEQLMTGSMPAPAERPVIAPPATS